MAITFQFPELNRIKCLFTGKGDGNISFKYGLRDAVLKARSALPPFAECQQAHGTRLLYVGEPSPISALPADLPIADGLAASRPGLALMIKTADCQPLLLAHRSQEYIMALHIGWRANRNDFIKSALADFCDAYHIRAADIYAVRGPSLGPVKAEFINFEQEWGEAYKPWFDPMHKSMDLWSLTRAQLLDAGIKKIYSLDICTFLNSESYFSYRKNKNSGRQASLIWIEKTD